MVSSRPSYHCLILSLLCLCLTLGSLSLSVSSHRPSRPLPDRPAITPPHPYTHHTHNRSPDTSKIKSKMVYAASKDALRKKLVGVATEIQATDFSEVSYDVVLEKVSKSVSTTGGGVVYLGHWTCCCCFCHSFTLSFRLIMYHLARNDRRPRAYTPTYTPTSYSHTPATHTQA